MVAIEQDEAQQLLERTADAVTVVDARHPHLPILALNRACRAAIPAGRPAPLGQPWAAIFPEFAALGLGSVVRRAIASGEPCAIPGPLLASGDGSATMGDWQCRPLVATDGTIGRVAIIGGAAHRASPQRPGTPHPVAAQPPLGFALLTGAAHTVAFANVALAALLGRSPAAQPFAALHPALGAPQVRAALDAARATARPQTLTLPLVATPGGTSRRWAVRLLPTPGGDEHPGGILVVISDSIASPEPAEEGPVATHSNHFAALLAALPEGAFAIDRAGRLDAANEAGRTLLALPLDAAGQPFGSFLAAPRVRGDGAQADALVRELLAPLLAGAARTEATVAVELEDGAHQIALTATPSHGADGAVGGAIIMARDLTVHGRAEIERDAFLALISHELRSPLTSIKGFAQLAVRALDSPDPRRASRHLHVIDQQTERIGRLIGDISDVSRLQRGKFALAPIPFDLVPVIEMTVAQQRAAYEKHPLALSLPEEPLVVRADPARIEQALAQLLANAAHFSPADGAIAVNLDRQGDDAILRVRDHGVGVPEAERERIFERFFRGAAVGGSGLGLGLFIVAQIVERSGGTIGVENPPDGGACFTVTLPLARPEAGEED